MSEPERSADRSVRVGWSGDAAAIAGVQVRAWRVAYADVLPAEALDAMDADAFADRWRESLTRPRDARQRVLVALDEGRLVGFAVTAPAQDPDTDPVADGELVELLVDPDETGQGHGSRLLHAGADTLRADGFHQAVMWLPSTSDDLRAFLVDAGWAADGAHRELDLRGDGAVVVKQVRLHTDLRSS